MDRTAWMEPRGEWETVGAYSARLEEPFRTPEVRQALAALVAGGESAWVRCGRLFKFHAAAPAGGRGYEFLVQPFGVSGHWAPWAPPGASASRPTALRAEMGATLTVLLCLALALLTTGCLSMASLAADADDRYYHPQEVYGGVKSLRDHLVFQSSGGFDLWNVFMNATVGTTVKIIILPPTVATDTLLLPVTATIQQSRNP